MTRPTLLALTLLALGLRAGDARAEPLGGYLREPNDGYGCSEFHADVHRWTWKDGGQVAFLTRLVLEGGPDFVVLGADADGVWTYEQDSDAGGASSWSAFLVHTSWGGARRRHLVDASFDGETRPVEERRAAVESRLWAWVAEGERARTVGGRLERLYRALTLRENPPAWDPRGLSQDLAVEIPRRDAEGRVKYPGWLAHVSSGEGSIRFGLASTSYLCWCGLRWTARAA